MPKRFLILWTGFALLFSVQITSCSLIGYGVGSAIDATRQGKLRPGTRAQVFKLPPGARLSIRMADGTVVAGTYRGLATQPDSSYVRRYTAWTDTAEGLPFRAPRIGEPIRIDGGKGYSMASRKVEGVFLGFGPRRVNYRPRNQRSTYTTFQGMSRMVDRSGQVISTGDLAATWDRLPVQTIAILRSRGRETRIDLQDERIVAIRFAPAPHGFRTAGLVVGILADATIIVAVAALASSPPSYGSCQPTYTGGGYYTLAEPIPAESSDSIYVLPRAREWLAVAR